MKKLLITCIGLQWLIALAGCSSSEPTVPASGQAGYERVQPAGQTADGQNLFPSLRDDEIELTNYFAYACPHCFQFEPELQQWLKTEIAQAITFKKVPVGMLPAWVDHARLFHVAESTGFLNEIHLPLFDAIHLTKPGLKNDLETLAGFAVQWAQQKADKNQLIARMESDEVAEKIIHDNKIINHLGINLTPTLVLRYRKDDEYVFIKITNKTAKAYGGIITVLNKLIESLQHEA